METTNPHSASLLTPNSFDEETTASSSRPLRRLLCRKRNLALVYHRSMEYLRADFETIAANVSRMAPDIAPVVVRDHLKHAIHPRWFLRPTLVFSPVALKKLHVPRGSIFAGQWLAKSEELSRLQRCGLPVPCWTLLTRDGQPPPDNFGPYVVTKPNVGGQGAEVKIKRATRVRWKAPQNRFALNRNEQGLLVQEFIYTGPWPVSYRVTTLFGHVLFSCRVEANHSRRPLTGADKFREGGEHGGGMSICSSGTGCTFTFNEETDVLTLGEQACRAFPENPLLGIDIVREQPSGRLFILEVNSSGSVWHFSSPRGKSVQQSNGIDFEAQFDGLHRAAESLIDATRRLAA